MKITQNFQLTVFITVLGISFLGQAAQVAPTPVPSTAPLPQATSPISRTEALRKQLRAGAEKMRPILRNKITEINNRLAQIEQAITQSSTPIQRRAQLAVEQKALQSQLAKVQAQQRFWGE
jgi:hypothetical protein